MSIRIQTLGGLHVARGDEGEILSLLRQPTRVSLLTFISVEGETTRDRAIDMFWADRAPSKARHSLSQTLYEIRREIDQDWVDVDGERLCLGSEVWVDVHEFMEADRAGEVDRALELYRGPFLHRTHLANERSFEGWVDRYNSRFARIHRRLRSEQIQRLEEAGETLKALTFARKWVEIDPFDDEAQHSLIKLAALSGQRSEALRQFEKYRELLREEMDIDPLDQTFELVEQIRSSDGTVGAEYQHEPVLADPSWDGTTIAVLPFDNLGGDDESEPFVRGIHGDLLTRLSKISDLRVIARTSVEKYRDSSERSLSVIARELGADWVLEGGVQRAGSHVRVHAHLVNTAAGQNIWAETFDRELTVENVFGIQSDIAQRIAGGLKKEFSPSPGSPTSGSRTESLESYALYQRGHSELIRRTPGGIQRAVEYFRLAIDKDPGNALAHTGLADVYLLGWYYGYFPSETTLLRGRQFAMQAVELAPDVAKCHASRGLAEFYLRNSREAERAYLHALELEPDHLEARLWYGTLLMWLDEWDQGREHVEVAAKLDPLAPFPHGILSAYYFHTGELDRSEWSSRRAIEVEPRYAIGRLHLGSILGELGRHEEAIAEIERGRAEMPSQADHVFGGLAQLATAHALAGHRDEAENLLKLAIDEGNPQPWIGWAYAALGEFDQAFEWLGRATWVRDQVARLKLASGFRYLSPLRSDPRFSEILRQFEEQWGIRGPSSGNPTPLEDRSRG